MFLFSFCSVSVLGSPVYVVSVSADGLSGWAIIRFFFLKNARWGIVVLDVYG
jgi:hypothetical protein